MTSDSVPSPEQLAQRQAARASHARYRLLASMLTTYGYGLVTLAVMPTLIPVRQPSTWVRLGELGLAMVFLAVAFFIAPKAQGEPPVRPD